MRRIKYLALFALAAFAACDEEPTGTDVVPTGTVQVTVTAAGTGVAGATVSLGAAGTQPAQTNAQGQVTFSNVAAGTYVASVSGLSADYACAQTSQPVVVAGGQTTAVQFACNLVQTSSIAGSVSNTNGSAFSGASVAITRTAPAPAGTPVTVTTGTNGQFSLTGLRSGTYTVVLATTANCTTAATTQTVTIAAGEARVVNFTCTTTAPPPPVEPATVSIESITAGPLGVGGTVLDNAVAGIVTVNVAVNEGGQRVTRVEVLLGGQQVCNQVRTVAVDEQGQELADFMISCVVNTAEFNPTTGVARFLNTVAAPANNNFTARIFTVAGGATNPAATAIRTIALTNADGATIIVTPQSTVLGGTGQGTPNLSVAGLTWWYGNLTILALPTFYSGHTATNVTVNFNAMRADSCLTSTTVDRANYRIGACQQAATVSRVITAAPYTATLLAANGINSGNNATSTDRGVGQVEDVGAIVGGGLNIQITSIRNDGQPGPNVNFSSICDDGRVPNPAPPFCASGQPATPIRFDTFAPLIDQMDQIGRWSESFAFVAATVSANQNVTRWVHDLAFEMVTNNDSDKARATDRGTGTTGTFWSFEYGTAVDALAPITAGTAMAETLTNNIYYMRANARDIAGNTRGRYRDGTTAGLASPLSTANLAAIQLDNDARLGADHHAPFLGLTATGSLNVTGEVIGPVGPQGDGTAVIPIINDCQGVVDPVTNICTIDTFTSNPSGFPPGPVKTRIRREYPGIDAAALCWVGNYGGNNPTCRTLGTQSNQSGMTGSFDFLVGSYNWVAPGPGGGPPGTTRTTAGDGVTLLSTIPVGYYRGEFQVVDAAGGNSALTDVRWVRDIAPPVVGGVLFPAVLTPGAQTSFQAGVGDDLDLDRGEFFLVAGTELDAYRQSVTSIGTFGPGDGSIGPAGYTQQANLATTIPFIYSIQSGTLAAPSATTQGSFRVRDFGRNSATAYSSPFPPPATPLRNYTAGGPSVGVFGGSESLNSSFNILCWDTDTNGCPTNVNTSAVVSFTLVGAGSAAPGGPLQIPFTRVDFLVGLNENNDAATDDDNGALPGGNVLWTVLGPAGVSVTENVGATQRTYNWSRSVTAAELAAASGRTLISVAGPVDPANNVFIRVIGYSADGAAFTLADGAAACPVSPAAGPAVCTIQLTRN